MRLRVCAACGVTAVALAAPALCAGVVAPAGDRPAAVAYAPQTCATRYSNAASAALAPSPTEITICLSCV